MRIHWLGVVFGLASAFLVMGLVTLGVWLVLSFFPVESPAVVAAIAGAPFGALVGGYVGGRTAVRGVFHGGLVGVCFAGAVLILSVLDGSPADVVTMLAFVAAGVVLGTVGGVIAEWRRGRRGPTAVD